MANPTENTILPKAGGKDLAMQVRLIEEKYRKFFPEITYFKLKKQVTAVADPADAVQIIGASGTTQFDRLWGEQVPASMETTGWQQPHLSEQDPDTATHDAPDRGEYEDAVEIHGRVQRIAREDELKKYGFDRLRDLILHLPLFTMQKIGLRPRPGDYFIWDGDQFDVKQVNRRGWWKNTNVRLYYVISSAHRHLGS